MVNTAASLYALAHGQTCTGEDECYFCGSPCPKLVPHGQPPPVVGRRGAPAAALRPGNQYVCLGCQLWARKKVTTRWTGGGFKDGCEVSRHPWLVTPGGCWSLRPNHPTLLEASPHALPFLAEDATALWLRLLRPPCRFFLSLIVGDCKENLLQLARCNDNPVVATDTPLHFTLNNAPHTFTLYELYQSTHNTNGLAGGARELVKLLGPVPDEALPPEELKARQQAKLEPCEQEAGLKATRQPVGDPNPRGRPGESKKDQRAGLQAKQVRRSGG